MINYRNIYTFSKYCTEYRWKTYYEQIKYVMTLKNDSILVIGPGDHIVPVVLQHLLPNSIIDTFDIKEGSTYHGDLRNISDIITKQYDCILCCEVLEHIEFEYFESILNQLKCISQNILISLPIFSGKICKYHKWEVNFNYMYNIENILNICKKIFNTVYYNIELNKYIFLNIS